MKNFRLTGLTIALGVILFAAYSIAALQSVNESISPDRFLSTPKVSESQDEVALRLVANALDIERGVLEITATPQLSGNQGISTSNGSYLKQSISFSFDVFSGPTLLDVPTGQFLTAQTLGLRLNGSPANYPFDRYQSKFYATASSDFSEDGTTKLVMRDETEAIPGFSGSAQYLSFLNESSRVDEIQGDIDQGMGLIEWRFERANSTVVAAFLLGGLMLVGAAVSGMMTLSVLRGARPPSIASLVWFAAFLFALFQVRNQLPGNPPNGIKFDLYVFYPVILLLIILIAINVQLWNNRDDWDSENPRIAVRGQIDSGQKES